MAILEIVEPHRLGQEEALRRIKGEIAQALRMFSDKISDFKESWKDNKGNMSFSFQGFTFNCNLTVTPSQVITKTDVPFIVMMFKGKIEEVIRPAIRKILA